MLCAYQQPREADSVRQQDGVAQSAAPTVRRGAAVRQLNAGLLPDLSHCAVHDPLPYNLCLTSQIPAEELTLLTGSS